MPKQSLKDEILATGALQLGEFTAHNGELGNQKIVLDSLLNDDEYTDLRGRLAVDLASKIKRFKPEVVIPMPEGANRFGIAVARCLGVRAILLEHCEDEPERLRFKDQKERIVVGLSKRVAMIDDVLRTGSQFCEATDSIELTNKNLIAGVIWDRSNPKLLIPENLGFPVKAVISEYIPMLREGS